MSRVEPLLVSEIEENHFVPAGLRVEPPRKERLFHAWVQRFGIFPYFDELLLLALGIGALTVALFAFFISYKPAGVEWTSEEIITHSLLLNYVHVGFTFALLWQVPALRKLAVDGARPWGLRSPALAFALFATVMWASYLDKLWAANGLRLGLHYRAHLLNWTLFLYWGAYHWTAQTLGLSTLYTNRLITAAASEQREVITRAQKRERTGFRLMILFIGVDRAMAFANIGTGHYSIPNWLAFGAATFIVLNSLRMKSPLKTCFLLRVFIYPMIDWHGFFLLGAQALHGIEYFLVTRQLYAGSKTRRLVGISIFAIILGLILCSVQVAHENFRHLLPEDFKPAQQWIHASVLGFSMMHYYLDGFIFRFRNVSVKRYVSPFLLKKSGA